jgi:hypothetical protein
LRKGRHVITTAVAGAIVVAIQRFTVENDERTGQRGVPNDGPDPLVEGGQHAEGADKPTYAAIASRLGRQWLGV